VRIRFEIVNLQSRISNLELLMRLTITLTAIVFLLVVPFARGQDVQVSASLSSDTVGVEDQLQFTLTVSGADSGDAEAPRLSRIEGFRIVSGPSVSTQYQWINGRSSSSKSFIYELIPEREGQFTIGSVDVRVRGKTYKTQPVQVRVTSAPRNPAPRTQRPANPFDPFQEEEAPARKPAGGDVFIRAELDRNSAYAGQQVTLSYKLYTEVGVSGIELQENPQLSGFWVENLEVEKNPKGLRQVVNGREYLVYTIKRQALFATITGQLKIPSSLFAVSATSQSDFFGVFGRTETLYRKTQELSLDVRPLPEKGRPAGFSNAVGEFNLSAAIDKSRAATGEAVAFRVTLQGRGNIKMIPDISIPSFPDFTIYSSKRADNIRTVAENQIGGDKTWEYVIVPKAPGRQFIPALSFSYFNAERDRYETVTTPALELDVVRGKDNAGSILTASGDKQSLTRRGTDINFIKPSAGTLDQPSRPVYGHLWFYLLAAMPLAFNAGALIYQRQRSRLKDDAGLIRRRNAKRKALQQLKNADREARSQARSFYDRASTALSGYLGDRFGLSEIELAGDTLDRALSARSISTEIIRETRACLQECDFGRFVSASGSTDQMHVLSARIRKNIEQLEQAG
jgi:hypothetical protein